MPTIVEQQKSYAPWSSDHTREMQSSTWAIIGQVSHEQIFLNSAHMRSITQKGYAYFNSSSQTKGAKSIAFPYARKEM